VNPKQGDNRRAKNQTPTKMKTQTIDKTFAVAGDYCFTRTRQGWRNVGMIEKEKQDWYASYYINNGRDGLEVTAVAFVPFCYNGSPNVMTPEQIDAHSTKLVAPYGTALC